MNLKPIGIQIKRAREKKHLTQEQLAEMVNLSTTHISVIERGIKAPKLETFVDIANALDVTSDVLLTDILKESLQVTSVSNELAEKIKNVSIKEQKKILKIVQVLVDEE